MGTSGMFDGSKSGLLPSWVDEPMSSPAAPPNGTGDDTQDDRTDDDDGLAPPPPAPHQYPPMPAAPDGSGLARARSNMTRGARTSNADAIQRAASTYVSASGGARAAARRIPNSRAMARGVARLAHSFANRSPAEALRQFNLEGMAGAPAEDVFVALTDILCAAGGTIDEAIARSAMLETVADLAAAGVGNFDELSADDLHEFFIGVVSRSIEGKILNEVGKNTVLVPAGIAEVERTQNMLHDFVERCVRDEFEAYETDLGTLDGNAIDSFVDALYVAALSLMEALREDGTGG